MTEEARARMVDVTDKEVTDRRAVATGLVRMSSSTRALVAERRLDKGDALETARIAGIMAAKRTSELVPLCHPLPLTGIDVVVEPEDAGIRITATVRTAERTGVEMEALTAVAVAALTVYDMVKGIERGAEITDVSLLEKSGGKSGTWTRDER
ncbi:MAG TPA: cyclic pyranopterin monophosphate synthase MoaC [Actinomycetota bacterium]